MNEINISISTNAEKALTDMDKIIEKLEKIKQLEKEISEIRNKDKQPVIIYPYTYPYYYPTVTYTTQPNYSTSGTQ